MTNKIYKYHLRIGTTHLDLPEGAKVLSVRTQGPYRQHGEVCNLMLWALVDTDTVLTETRTFNVYGTGQAIEGNPGTYVATVEMDLYIWHIFEEAEEEYRHLPAYM